MSSTPSVADIGLVLPDQKRCIDWGPLGAERLACVARRPIWVPTRAMIAGRRTLMLAMEKAMRSPLEGGPVPDPHDAAPHVPAHSPNSICTLHLTHVATWGISWKTPALRVDMHISQYAPLASRQLLSPTPSSAARPLAQPAFCWRPLSPSLPSLSPTVFTTPISALSTYQLSGSKCTCD